MVWCVFLLRIWYLGVRQAWLSQVWYQIWDIHRPRLNLCFGCTRPDWNFQLHLIPWNSRSQQPQAKPNMKLRFFSQEDGDHHAPGLLTNEHCHLIWSILSGVHNPDRVRQQLYTHHTPLKIPCLPYSLLFIKSNMMKSEFFIPLTSATFIPQVWHKRCVLQAWDFTNCVTLVNFFGQFRWIRSIWFNKKTLHQLSHSTSWQETNIVNFECEFTCMDSPS